MNTFISLQATSIMEPPSECVHNVQCVAKLHSKLLWTLFREAATKTTIVRISTLSSCSLTSQQLPAGLLTVSLSL